MWRLRDLGAFTGSIVLLGTFGCTATVVEASSDGPATTTQALLVFERAERDGKSAQTNISAKFLRTSVAADPDTVESVVGSALELPSPGECLVVSDADSEPATVGSIELFDAGDITIATAAPGDIRLAARAFPDVGDRVSGVFYTSPDTERDLPAPGKYIIASTGSAAVDPFRLETEAPSVPADVTVAGRSLDDGLELQEGDTIDVAWRAPADAARDGLAYLEIVAENGVAARCAFDDGGRGVLPATLLRNAGFGPLPMAATLALHRVRQGGFHVTGVDSGEVRFDMSVAAAVTLLPSRRLAQ